MYVLGRINLYLTWGRDGGGVFELAFIKKHHASLMIS